MFAYNPSRAEAGKLVDVAQSGEVPGFVDQQKGSIVFQRYYHLFVEGELEAIASQVPGARVVSSCFDKSNWVVVIEHALV